MSHLNELADTLYYNLVAQLTSIGWRNRFASSPEIRETLVDGYCW